MPESAKLTKDQLHRSSEWRTIALEHFKESAYVQQRTASTCLDAVLKAAEVLATCFSKGKKVLICGNGGSAADAQHMAAEFMNRLDRNNNRPALPAVALTTDTSFLTAYANDCGWDGVFERQVQALGQNGDALVAISTSGNSVNVMRGVTAARDHGLITIGLLGEGGRLTSLVDYPIVIPSDDTQHVQETLLTVEHVLCLLVEESLLS
jgi:D-sedoheptulose 7-phosphate isomerase